MGPRVPSPALAGNNASAPGPPGSVPAADADNGHITGRKPCHGAAPVASIAALGTTVAKPAGARPATAPGAAKPARSWLE
jgi:hypothetical protein